MTTTLVVNIFYGQITGLSCYSHVGESTNDQGKRTPSYVHASFCNFRFMSKVFVVF